MDDDIDCDSSVLGDGSLVDGIEDCEDCEADEDHSVFAHHSVMDENGLNEHLNATDCGLAPRVVIVSNDDSLPDNISGEPSSEEISPENSSENDQTYVFTLDGGSGIYHATPVNSKNGNCKDKEDSQSVSQAWFTSRDEKNKLHECGKQWKQGMWSKEEAALLDDNIKHYCIKNGFADPAEIIFELTKDERKDFYRTISKGLNRPLFSVYRRVIRMYDKKNHIGRYTAGERSKLKRLHEKHGNDWQSIGSQLGRSASSIKDKCRLMKDNCNIGKWFPEEEKLLSEAVYELSNVSTGDVVSSGISWTRVAERVKTRSEKQCRTKWLNYLNWKHAGGSEWTREDDVKLVTKMYSLEVEDENEINWAVLASGWKSVRSPQWLRGKWWSLKRHVANANSVKFKDICRQLYGYHVENAKFISNLVNSETETSIVDTLPGIELLTPTAACLPLPQVRFVSIPNVVQISPSIDLDSSQMSSDTATAVLKSDATSSMALQTFEIVSPNLQLPTNGNPGTFFITSQGTAIQYPSNTLTSSSSIILQTLTTDSIHMNVPTQLIITDNTTGLVTSASANRQHAARASQFAHSVLSGVSLSRSEIDHLDFENGDESETDAVRHSTTVQTDVDHSDQTLPSEFILSDPLMHESNDGHSVLDEDGELLQENSGSDEDI